MFNNISDGFGIGIQELEEICADLKDELNVSRLSMIENIAVMFELLDTDKNGLIDALEFMSTFAGISGMRFHEIMDFVLKSYDFDGTSVLSIDEVTLALKSMSTGLCKISHLSAPREESIEYLVSMMFHDIAGADSSRLSSVRISVLVQYLISHPDIKSWFSFFDSGDIFMPTNDLALSDIAKNPKMNISEYTSKYGIGPAIEYEIVPSAVYETKVNMEAREEVEL